MSIKLRFEKGSLVTTVMLKDEALSGLLEILSKYQSDDAPPPASSTPQERPSITDLADPNKERVRIDTARNWMAEHSAAEALSKIGWPNFSERILILGALIEAKGGDPGWRSSDIENQFRAARETPPSNFARDVSLAIKAGIIATETPRTYSVSKTGWLKLYEAIIQGTVEAQFAKRGQEETN